MKAVAVVVAAAAFLTVLAPPGVSYAHTGTDVEVTSNYQTRLTEVPVDPGLDVEIIDITGTMRVTWRGNGTVIIDGYEGEPYLRIGSSGVERNARSPATYLNQDRYAKVELPETADAAAPAEWELISAEPTIEWHDHRNHWMSTVPPAEVQADRDERQVIYDHWEIAMSIDGREATIGGELVWIPPPSTPVWVTVAGLVAGIALIVLFSRWWRICAAVVASFAAILFTADTLGYYLESSDTVSNRLFTMFFPLLAIVASIRLWIQVRRGVNEPTLAMMLGGLVLALLGGVDRYDVLTNSQIFAAGPSWLPRVAVVVSLGVGSALMLRFLAFLFPLLLGPTTLPHQSTDQVTP